MCHNKLCIGKVSSEEVSPQRLTSHIYVRINYVFQQLSKAIEGVNKKCPSVTSCNMPYKSQNDTFEKKLFTFEG